MPSLGAACCEYLADVSYRENDISASNVSLNLIFFIPDKFATSDTKDARTKTKESMFELVTRASRRICGLQVGAYGLNDLFRPR